MLLLKSVNFSFFLSLLLVIQLNGSLALDCVERLILCHNPNICLFVRLIQFSNLPISRTQLYMPALHQHHASCAMILLGHFTQAGFMLCCWSNQHASSTSGVLRYGVPPNRIMHWLSLRRSCHITQDILSTCCQDNCGSSVGQLHQTAAGGRKSCC